MQRQSYSERSGSEPVGLTPLGRVDPVSRIVRVRSLAITTNVSPSMTGVTSPLKESAKTGSEASSREAAVRRDFRAQQGSENTTYFCLMFALRKLLR